MTPHQIRTTRESLGLTQGQVARLVGVDARSWRRWEAGGGDTARTMPEPVARLLMLMSESPGVVAWLGEMAER